ncbi:MAG: glycosyltransferase family 39 protein [Nitrospirae bacterium]|nr:glycosyltransferase family 39 protein [Nitrospirota bacterium]MBI3593546.1 glycosyltransferase family 39 protein [Nitrospirota bacterium]
MIASAFLFLFVLLTSFRFYFAAHFNLTPDESYYWYWSEHLQLSYYDHPPMVAWLMRLSTSLFGQGEWAVRLPALLMGIGDTWMIYDLAKRTFKSPGAGLVSAMILNSIMIFSVGMVIFTPDTPQLFFWIAATAFAYRATVENRSQYWFLTGIAFGLGLLSKYTMILFLPALLLFLLFNAPFRSHLASWKSWLSLLIAFLIFSPVMIWNYQNQWISFLFQFHHGTLSRESTGLRYLFEFLGSQAGIFSPLLFMAFFWAWVKAYRIGRVPHLWQFSFLFWMVFPLFVFFIYKSLHSKIEANWPVFCQTGSIVLLGGFFYQKLRDRKDSFLMKSFIYISVGLAFLMMLTVHLQAMTKFIPLKVERDRTNDLIGWSEMKAIYSKFPEFAEDPVITTNHTMVGEVSYYLKNKRVFQWGSPFRITDLSRIEPIELNQINEFLLVTFDRDQFPLETLSLFERIAPVMEIPVFVKRGNSSILIRTYHFFRGEHFKGFVSPISLERIP